MSKEDVLLFGTYGMRGTGKSYFEKLKEKDKEIERLQKARVYDIKYNKYLQSELAKANNIIKEVREYADEWNSNWYATGSEEDHQRLHELLEILDKEN